MASPRKALLIVVFDVDQTLVHHDSKIVFHPEFYNIFRFLNHYKDVVHCFLYTNGLTHLHEYVVEIFETLGDVKWLNRHSPRRHDMIIRDVFAGGKRCTRPLPRWVDPKSFVFAHKWSNYPVFDLRKGTALLRECLSSYYKTTNLPRIILFDDCACNDASGINTRFNGWELYDDFKFKLYHTPFVNKQFSSILPYLIDEVMACVLVSEG